MPYITQNKRAVLDKTIEELSFILNDLKKDDSNNMEGNLNYIITRLIRLVYGTSYREINDCVGMLQCVILEHYRKRAAPYEDQKERENGLIETDIEKK